MDVWRVKHPRVRQYTWVRVVDGNMSAARLDRIYMTSSFCNRLLSSHIYPVSFTDHHLVTLDFHISPTTKCSSYWHFNIVTFYVLNHVLSRHFLFYFEILSLFCNLFRSHSLAHGKFIACFVPPLRSGFLLSFKFHSSSASGEILCFVYRDLCAAVKGEPSVKS